MCASKNPPLLNASCPKVTKVAQVSRSKVQSVQSDMFDFDLQDLANLAVEHAPHVVPRPARLPQRQQRVAQQRAAGPQQAGRGGRGGLGPGRNGGLWPGRNGRGRGCRGVGLARRRSTLKRSKSMKETHKTHRQRQSRLQASHANSSGRSRTADHLMPMESSEKRAKVSGQGAWKVWTPEALLRAAFAQTSSALRQVASEIDGASAAHVLHARSFVSGVLLKKQEEGLVQELGKARHSALSEPSDPPKLWILNLMFDETELDLKLKDEGPGAWSILASHSQLSVGSAGNMVEHDFIRVPQALPRKTTSCMWAALNLGAGGLGPSNICSFADFPCVLVTCDQASANIKLLKHLHSVLPEQCFFLPMLCAQHRNGNVVERLTKLFGILPGSYCVAKCTSKGKVFKDLREAVKEQIDKDLVVMSEEPPGLQAEWSSARKQATTFLELMLQGLADDKPEERSGVSQRIQKFVDFFRGPWTGPSARLSYSAN